MIICVVGPTGVGKTKLSVMLAKKYNGIIINADACQIYKELNIGTAKIREEEKLKQEFEEFKKFNQRQEEKKPITESEPSIQDRKEYKTVIQKPLKIYEEKP